MKLELVKSDEQRIIHKDYGHLLDRVEAEFDEMMVIIRYSREYANNIYRFTSSLLYLRIDDVDVPDTIETAQELQEWYLMEVQ